MAHDVFISYSKHDKVAANATCAQFESRNIRCWIAPRDVLAGTEYADAILTAINDCRVMVLIFSGNSNASVHIHKEVERAVSKGKIIVSFRIQDAVLSKSMEYYLSDTHWLDALTPPLVNRIDELVATVSRLLAPLTVVADTATRANGHDQRRGTKRLLYAATLIIAALCVCFASWPYATRRTRAEAAAKFPSESAQESRATASNHVSGAETSVSEGDVTVRFVDASLVRERVLAIDHGQGFASLLGNLQAKWRDAEIARLGHDWPHALTAYEAVIEGGRQIDALEAKRHRAVASREASEAARLRVSPAHAATLLADAWQAAVHEATIADTLFEKGQFDEACEKWTALVSRWKELHAQAEDIAAYNGARATYESTLASVKVPETARSPGLSGPVSIEEIRSFLAQPSSPVWPALLAQEQVAQNTGTNFEARGTALKRAITLVEKASSWAHTFETQRCANRQIDEKAKESTQPGAPVQTPAVLTDQVEAPTAARKTSLIISAQTDGHEVLGAIVCQSGVSGSWRTPARIGLKDAMHYEFCISNSNPDAGGTLPAKLVLDANWTGERTECVQLTPANIVRPIGMPTNSDDSVDSHLYFSLGALTSQPQQDPARFVKSENRFKRVSPTLVFDTLLAKTWVLYNPNEIMSYENARSYASSQKGRLPTLRELSSLLVLRRGDSDWARLNGTFFQRHQRTTQFWAEETGIMNMSMLCRLVDFGDGTASKTSSDDQCAALVIRD